MAKKEHSAGGIIFEDGRVLLVLMRNLEGKQVWTFPKGHLEAGETAEAAAVREVEEETGFFCEIVSDLYRSEYSFVRGGDDVQKDVRWFMMKRVGGDGIPKATDEILDLRWHSLEEAEKEMLYLSDLAILDLLKNY